MTKRKSHSGRPGLGAAARCIVLAALGIGWPVTSARADGLAQLPVTADTAADTAPEEGKKKDLPPKPVFAPDVEKQLADFLAKATEARRKSWIEKMGALIEKRAKAIGLDDQGRKALEAPSREVVELSLAEWMDDYERTIRNAMKQAPAEVLESLKAAAAAPESIGMMLNGVENTVTPQDQGAWTRALKRTLTPDQFAAWEKSTAEERQRLHAEIGDRLDGWLAPAREAMQESLFTTATEMSRSLHLPKDRADQLNSLAREAVGQSIGKLRERQEKWLAAMEDTARHEMLKNRNIYLGANPEEAPATLPIWKTGLARLLSADERKRLETEAAEHTIRRAHALARLMAAVIDTQVALTANQRQRLEPICDRLAEKDVETLCNQSGESYFQFDIFNVLASGLKSSETEVQAILGPIQWQHWLDACDRMTEKHRGSSRPALTKRPEEKATIPPEPEEYERALSDYLEVKTRKVRQQALAEALLRAEDAGRVANLPAEKVEHLKTAARGAVEESLRNWKSNADQTVRSFAGETPVRLVRRRLESLQEYNFQRKLDPPPETQALWIGTLKADLDADQAAAAEKSANERDAFRAESIASFIVAMFDQSHLLTVEQQAKMTTAIGETIREYQPDILNYFSGFNSTAWYLSSYSMFLPLVAVPESELKSILGPESFDRWMRSRQCAYTMNYWSGLKQNHDARVKSARK